MAGTEKLPLLVLGKSQKPRCFKNVKSLPVTYRANKRAWMTGKLFTEWLKILDDQMYRNRRKIALIVDNCKAHPDVTNLRVVQLVFLPPNTTSVTQPMDQGVIKNLKVFYRKMIVARKISSIDTSEEFTVNVLDAVYMLKKAWGRVKPETISNCFRKAGFKQAAEDEVTSDIEEDADDDIPLARLAGIVGPNFNIRDFMAIDDFLPAREIVTDCDIISDLIEMRSADENGEASSDDEPTPEQVEPATSLSALKSCEVVRAFLQTRDNNKIDEIFAAFHRVEDYIQKEHLNNISAKQTLITSFFFNN